METASVKSVTETGEDQAIDVIALAFCADPTARWLYSDPHQFMSGFPAFVRAVSDKAFEHDSGYYIDGFLGAALWLPPEVEPDEEKVGEVISSTIPEALQEEVGDVLEQMDTYHPSDAPCWYLPFIGVDPTCHGKGYGSILMQHALIPCDRDGILAYLESSNPLNIPFYERLGFEVMGKIQVGSSPPIHPMLRHPRPMT